MLKRKLVVALALVASTMSMSMAASSASPNKASAPKGAIPAALQFAQKSANLEIEKEFPAAGGLKGWLVKEPSGRHIVVYTTQDGEVLIAGMALDKAGKNLTAQYAEQYAPQVDYSPAYKAFTSEAASVMVGNSSAKAEVTIVFDANCGFCKAMHKLVQPAVDAGELRVRYVPVAIMGQDSDTKGAGLLAAKNPAEAVDSPDPSNDKALIGKVMSNTALMKKYGFNGTPVVMYKSKVGGPETLYVSPGVPNILEMFAKLGISGQVEKLKADPSLARFVR